jgi:tryptophan synthase beta chain
MGPDQTIVLCLSGRGDKDVESVGKYLGMAAQ